MLKKILIGLAAVLVLICIVAATRPNTYTVERSASIDAPPPVVHGIVVDFHRWDEWSPWAELDPKMTKTFSGPDKAVGSVYEWVGNDDVGAGKMTLTEVKAPEAIVMELKFLKPWESTSKVTLSTPAEGAGTKITWRMDGNHNFASKVMCLFMDMDAMIGKDFEKGLGKLKTLAEAEAKKAPAAAPEAAAPPAAPAPAAPEAPAPAPAAAEAPAAAPAAPAPAPAAP